MKLFIKNMVCNRCVMTVENILNSKGIGYTSVIMGEVDLKTDLNEPEREDLSEALSKVGFEMIETRLTRIIEDIKKLILKFVAFGVDRQQLKLSTYITNELNYDYSYLSDLFSSIEGKTIEQYFIQQRIEKVKELLVYDQLTLTEIAFQTGFSSVHHLSSQFKKITGLTPSHFKKIGSEKRKAIDSI